MKNQIKVYLCVAKTTRGNPRRDLKNRANRIELYSSRVAAKDNCWSDEKIINGNLKIVK